MTQRSLFPAPPPALDLADAALRFDPEFLGAAAADRLFAALLTGIAWRQDEVVVFGRRHRVPRLQQWFAEGGRTYTWSGIRMTPSPWSPALLEIRDAVAASTGIRFNTALANLYRDGDDAVGWHADDEPELGPRPVIASVSLGAARDFRLRHRGRADVGPRTITLTHGSLLVMGGGTQEAWEHCVPRRRGVDRPRINLTFRSVVEGC